MIRTQISVDEELYGRAKEAARREGVSFEEFCRRSLAATLSRRTSDKPWMAYVGAFDGDPEDSVSVDETLYGRVRP